ncbi:LacI family DNA-binding transcriptional regulator [Kitasatospora sp. NPDC097643]|uniref:LacI family DNA-binding transcriptional regulator n=1 Tax=Kitasatospora sp. NPDC097643 TaxID=3157230 RepID=UPI0033302F7B
MSSESSESPDPAQQGPAHQVTSADVARAAKVSRTTVSLVLNDTPSARISERTRERVRAAAEQLGYVPHAAARSLRAGQSDLVLLPFAVAAIGGLAAEWVDRFESAVGELGYTVVLHGDRVPEPLAAARAWARLRPAAVVASDDPRLTADAARVLHRAGVRAVIASAPAPVEGVYTLIVDHAELGEAAVRHLLERGCRTIGVVMPTERGLATFAEPRLAGARRAAAAYGAEIVQLPMRCSEEAAAALAVLCRELGLDAVFGCNDEYAALLCAALGDLGVAVPGQIAVAGADDLLLGRVVRPRLTTVRFHPPAPGVLAETLHALVTTGAAEPLPPVRFEVVVRESS